MLRKTSVSIISIGLFILVLNAGPASAQPVVDQSFTSPFNAGIAINHLYVYIGQTFTSGMSGTLAGVSLWVSTAGGYPMQISIHSVDGGVPTPTVLASTQLALGESADWTKIITFPQQVPMVVGQQYAIVVNFVGAPPHGGWGGNWRGYIGSPDGYPWGDIFGSNDASVFQVYRPDQLDAHFITYVSPITIVSIDVKPGSDPNSINPRSKGVIAVAILTTSTAAGESVDFDATQVDPETVEFGIGGARMAHSNAHLEDVDWDGDTDMVIHFRTQETGIECGFEVVDLTGSTFDGQQIQGSDSILTVGCK